MKLFKTPRFFRWIFPNKTWGFSRSDRSIYLTFDDGPDPLVTPWVLDRLKENNVKATFFCVGENVLKNPEIYQRILIEGHSVGNHSMNHLKGIKTSVNEYLQSIEDAGKYIDSQLFRPPYGRISIRQTHRIKSKYHIIMWSWLSYDFDRIIPIDQVLQKAKRQLKSGDIIVLHDNPKTFDRLKLILPQIIKILQEKELSFKAIKN